MKRILSYTLFLLFVMLGGAVNGQIRTDDPNPNGGGGELDGISCKNKDYQFKIEYEEDKFFFSGKTAFVCTRNLPLNVTIVDVNQNPIEPTEIRWSKNGIAAPSTTNLLKIKEADFANNISQFEVVVVFSLPQQGDTELKLKVKKNKVKFTEKSKIYAYDDNKIEEFISEHGGNVNEEINVPWNFLLMNGAAEELKAKIDKQNGIYAVPNIVAPSVNWLNITPDQIAPNRDADISFNANLLIEDRVIAVQACDKKPELFLYTGAMRTYDIRLYRVCESDDDVRVRDIAMPGEEQNLNFFDVCISPGPDGVIDFRDDPSKYPDDFPHDTGVVAGANGNCDAPMHPNDPTPDCIPVNFDFEAKLDKLNELASKIGVRYTITNPIIQDINVSFDSVLEDGSISDFNEVRRLGQSMESVIQLDPNNLIIHTALIDDLGKSDRGNQIDGYATSIMSDRLVLDVASANGSTWFHEIGHAFGDLLHPTEPTHFLFDDKRNFMSSGANLRINDNVRRYQFGKMRRQ